MKLTQALAVTATVLAVGVPSAGATPDGYQPQLKSAAQSDAIMRYLRNNAPKPQPQPDAIDRYLRNNEPQGSAGTHPDSRGSRFTLAVPATTATVGDEGGDLWSGAIGALLGAFATVLAIVGASAMRGRRRLAGAS